MKTKMFVTIIAVAMLVLTATTFAEVKTASIHTSAVCGMCKMNIEKASNSVDGVQKSTVNLDTKVATIIYDTDKTNINNIRKSISLAGYKADNVKPNKKAYKSLSSHCQSGYDFNAKNAPKKSSCCSGKKAKAPCCGPKK